MGPAGIGQTISVMDRSGKVISTSKTLIGVFKDAKSAYRERKAEIAATREAEAKTRKTQRALENLRMEEGSTTSSHRHKSKSKHTKRPEGQERRKSSGSSTRRHSREMNDHSAHAELLRRHTTREGGQLQYAPPPPGQLVRSATAPQLESDEEVDLDLAYGDVPPPLPLVPVSEEVELKTLLTRLNGILDEANCLQHSASKTITNLQKNPDAMAAVALTLAEVSQMVVKVAPGVLASMKGAFPAIFALLASPQFLIAAGVGVGITVVAFGGYKIVKRIQQRNAENQMDELQEIDADVSRIETWRRGIVMEPDAMTETTVDGEFITPEAAAMRDEAPEETALRRKDGNKPRKAKTAKSSGKSTKEKKGVKEKKAKGPSPLRILFT